jgi:hypothetical protein
MIEVDEETVREIHRALTKEEKGFNGWPQTLTIIVSIVSMVAILIGAQYSVLSARILRHEVKFGHDGAVGLMQRLDERSKAYLGYRKDG